MRWLDLRFVRDLTWQGWAALILVGLPTGYVAYLVDDSPEVTVERQPAVSSGAPAAGSTHPVVNVPSQERTVAATTGTPIQVDDLRSETRLERATPSPSV